MFLSSVLRLMGNVSIFPTLLLQCSHTLSPPACPRKDELPIDWFTAFMHRFSISTLLGAWPAALGWKGETDKTGHEADVNQTKES